MQRGIGHDELFNGFLERSMCGTIVKASALGLGILVTTSVSYEVASYFLEHVNRSPLYVLEGC